MNTLNLTKILAESEAAVATPRLTQQEILDRAGAMLQSLGITKDQIHRVSFYNEDTAFLRVMLKGITDENQFANIYFNDNAKVSFRIAKGREAQSVDQETFVQILPLLRTDRVPLTSTF